MVKARMFALGMMMGLATHIAAGQETNPDINSWLNSEIAPLVTLYCHLHEHPELSFREVETAKRVASALREAGCEVTERVAKTGVVAVLKNGDGPTVLVRTDLDALPVTEQTGLPYASRVTAEGDDGRPAGVMHACGHDIHMTCLVGTARWLAAHRDRWKGTVVFIGQPAEEKVGGAKAMLADGLYRRFPKPDYALALHVLDDLETGKVAYTAGPAMASSTSVDVTVYGRGGHGAAPHETIDPIVLAAMLIVDLQTIVSREIKPIDPAVVTVGSIHGGTKHNIIPSEVRLQLTLRAYSDTVRDKLIAAIKRRAKGLADAHGAPEPKVEVAESTPPTINDAKLVDRVVPMLKHALGDANVAPTEPVMGAEDFGLFAAEGVPIFMFRLGSIPPQKVAESKSGRSILPSAHSPQYAPDPEPTIRTGIKAMTAAVEGLLPPK
jgi:hippurate hydrolase